MLSGVERAQGQANYRGRLELVRWEDGIVVINELPLEEYLYGVVPGEMPASYPLEALKSQAVCARTYAYERLQRAGLPEYGAHVDDSTAFQVYQNLAEQGQTTRGQGDVRTGIILRGGAGADLLLFYILRLRHGFVGLERDPGRSISVSVCAGDRRKKHGADETAWRAESVAAMAPFCSRRSCWSVGVMEAFLGQRDGDFYEKEEPWYRWSYRAETVDEKAFWERVWIRAQADGQCVFVPGEAGEWNAVKERTETV